MLNQLGISLIGNSRIHYLLYGLLAATPILLYLAGFLNSPSKKNAPNIAFFYGKPVPANILAQFDRVVVEPDNVDNLELLKAVGAEVYAYVSIGEIHPSRAWYTAIPKDWQLGENKAWGSHVVDLSKEGWQEFLLTSVIKPLWERGYHGFFLDTLDSYQLFIKGADQQFKQQRALVSLIKTMHDRFPGIKLILNRGFEIIPQVSRQINGVAAESLFQRWDANLNNYAEVPAADRDWLLNKLNQIHKQTSLNIIVIDYVQPDDQALANKTADRIKQLGYTPWVATPGLDIIGVGETVIKPKQVLLVHDGKTTKLAEWQSGFLVKLAVKVMSFFGYSIEYQDIRKGLPALGLTGQYVCIVTLNDTGAALLPSNALSIWLERQKNYGMRVFEW